MVVEKKTHLEAVEYLLRISGWLLFINAEKVAASILKLSVEHINYYVVIISLTLGLLLSLRLLGTAPLIRDLQEICFYDVVVACYGLATHLLGKGNGSYLIFANAVLMLKFLRLIWWGRNLEGDLITGWPTFGFIGFFNKDEHKNNISKSGRISIYLACLGSICLAFIGSLFFKEFPAEILHFISLIAVLVFAKPAAKDIQARETERLEKVKQNAVLEARTKMDAHIKERNLDLCHATHDVRSPVNTMIQLAGNLEKCQDVSEAKLAAKHFESGLRELGDLLDEIIVMAQVTTDVVTQTDELISMDDLSYQLYEKLEPLAHARRVILAADDAPFFVTSNKWLLSRILSNLLTNAIVHGDKTTRVRLCIYRNRKHCYIRVWDTGQGMPDANGPDRAANFNNMLKVIHRKRGQNKAQGMTTLSGHGLGLRSVMRMCNTLGITMTLVSKPGKGSMFRFKLPLADPAAIAEKLPMLNAFDQVSKD